MESYNLVSNYNDITITNEISITIAILYLDILLYMIASMLLYTLQKRIPLSNPTDTGILYLSFAAFMSNGFVAKLIYGILMTEGLLQRNLMQVIICTLTQFVIMGIRLWITLQLDEGSNVGYIIMSVTIAGIAADALIMLYIAAKQRKEFSWFHYKIFGANIGQNKMFSIRKLLDLAFKTGFQLFISIWFVSFLIMDIGASLIIETTLYIILITIYQVDCYEIVLIRIINIMLNLLMAAYLLIQTIFFNHFVRPMPTEETSMASHPYLVITILLRLAVHLIYVILLITDIFSFNKGILVYLARKQKRRNAISSDEEGVKECSDSNQIQTHTRPQQSLLYALFSRASHRQNQDQKE
ncbi:hypothetical protein NEHOM01_1186 [Nematocida homosporus]|uniref:uncharacterized protein n=1 Tax=Nematocida homosporus TaxID=1912981 RepID=UPI00221EDB01|nr:uncharacterized protein NEHOM01_1186 [Nematocida homosporus]KAI5185963.1 hypothetical protein NEHOM01_1186 [Nematocida homosporus]